MADWKIGDPVPDATPDAIRLRFGGWMARRREDAGLSQGEAAERLGVSQQTVSKCERSGVASEEVLRKMWFLYQVPERYPSAPCDPVRRRAHFDAKAKVAV